MYATLSSSDIYTHYKMFKSGYMLKLNCEIFNKNKT